MSWAVHGLDPFTSRYVWFPLGADLAWDTSVPAASLFALPLMFIGGPVFAFNVLSVTAPSLAAWTMFLLARELTGDWGAALFGGYIFGFSAYELGELLGHLNPI